MPMPPPTRDDLAAFVPILTTIDPCKEFENLLAHHHETVKEVITRMKSSDPLSPHQLAEFAMWHDETHWQLKCLDKIITDISN